MPFCTPNCQKWTVLGFGVFFLIVGIVLVAFTDDIVEAVKDKELNLGSNKTTEYDMWKETPIPMYIEFYLFNWTNSKEVIESKWTVKPLFKQTGPYTYSEKHYREDVTFNEHNHTVTYRTKRIWHFLPEKSGGFLNDSITTVNPILLTVGNMVKFKHAIVRMGVNFFLDEKNINITVTQTAEEFIFKGYDDPLLDLFKKLHLRNINLPFDRFAWFATRNGSVDYDGTYNMFDGADDIRKLGRLTSWNFNRTTSYFPSYCGDVNGTSGELWYPVQDDSFVDVFSPDTCSTLRLVRDGNYEMYGIEGNKYVGDTRVFDNGTLHPEMACFNPGEVLPSGVRNISSCKFGAPAFVSYPHFYLADPYYRSVIDGMKPNKSEHSLYIGIEPETGIPLRAMIAAQINLRIEKIDRITLLKDVKNILLPAMWFKQYATLDEKLANQAKLLIMLPSIGQYTGYGVLGIGCLLFMVFGVILWKRYRKGSEEERLLNQDVF